MKKDKTPKPESQPPEPKKAPEILKIPLQLEAINWRKMPQDWGITFSCQAENLELLKPLMPLMNCHFIVALVKVDDISEANEYMKGVALEDVRLDEA